MSLDVVRKAYDAACLELGDLDIQVDEAERRLSALHERRHAAADRARALNATGQQMVKAENQHTASILASILGGKSVVTDQPPAPARVEPDAPPFATRDAFPPSPFPAAPRDVPAPSSSETDA